METRHEIKKRMISSAAKFWGMTSKEIETVDPLIPMLIDACAGEIEKISKSTHEVRQNMGFKLMEVITPELLLSPLPARSVMHAHPFELRGIVNENHEFYFKKQNPFDIENPDVEIYFTPVKEHLIFDAEVKFFATGNTLYRLDQSFEKSVVCKGLPHEGPLDSLWIGLSINKSIESLNGLCFYFEIENVDDIREKIFYQALNLGQWEINNTAVKVKPGYYNSKGKNDNKQIKVPYTETNKSFAITNHVLDFYKKHFVSITDDQKVLLLNEETFRQYPKTFIGVFDTEDLAAIDSTLLWIKVNFSQHIPKGILENIKCNINCFPVINRRKEKIVITGYDRIKELKIESHELFFDIKETSCEKKLEILLGEKVPKNMEGKALLTLRKDNIGRMDTTNAVDKIQQMIEAYQQEYAAFMKIKDIDQDDVDRLSEAVRPFENAIDKIRDYTAGSKPFVMLRTDPEFDDAKIEIIYYLTNGTLANKIRKGEPVQFDSAELIKDKLLLLTPTMGGTNLKKGEDLVREFKYALLTRDRLVTIEDIKALCYSHFGSHAETIEVKKGVDIGTEPGSGLRRIIDISIQLKKDTGLLPQEIKFLKDDLLDLLKVKSLNVIPYRIEFLP